MSRSPYIDHVVLTNKHSGKRTHKVQAFVIHHMAARWTGKRCAEYFRDTPNRQASANYCIGYDGDVALNVEEQNRAWTSSSNWADQRAITYELANSKTGHPWKISDATINKAIVMLAEQHKRYGIKRASYTGDKSGTLWRHDWFANTNCPGPYLGGKLAYMAREINKILDGGGSSSKPSSSTNVGKTLQLPASAETWKVYNPNGPYTTGNEIHSLTPKAFGGLEYVIKGNPATDVYLIDTGVKGRVAIYGAPSTGAKIIDNQVKEGWFKNNTGWWYRNADGTYPKGQWLKINGTWYLFDKRGYMLTGWQKVNDTWYYMNNSGAMQTGWVKLHDHWYYLNPNGAMATGWKRLGDEWYYLYSNGQMATGLIEVAGKNYYLQRNGVLITDSVVKLVANRHGHLK